MDVLIVWLTEKTLISCSFQIIEMILSETRWFWWCEIPKTRVYRKLCNKLQQRETKSVHFDPLPLQIKTHLVAQTQNIEAKVGGFVDKDVYIIDE